MSPFSASRFRQRRSRPRGHYGVAGEPGFPVQQMFILAMCRICEPIAFMSIFPYIYYMVEDFHITDDPNKISIYAGMVTSSFTLAEFLSGVFWGRLSDVYGRKPILLCGMAGTGLSALVFGFAPSLQVAMFARVLGGLLNGNIGVLQTTVAELITVKSQQSRAYTVMPVVWCIGSIIGPVIGGLMARPCISYPNIFPPGTIFERYPYLLPNLFSAFAVFCGLIVGYLFLEETHPKKKYDRDVGLEVGDKLLAYVQHTTQTHSDKVPSSEFVYGHYDESSPMTSDSEDASSISSEEQPLISDLESEPRYDTIFDGPEPQTKEVPEQAKIFNRQVVLNIVSYGILAFHTMTFDQLFPVFLSTKPSDNADIHLPFKFVGGFGLETKVIGVILAAQGMYSLISNFFIFPAVCTKVTHRRLYQMLALSYFVLYFVTPYVVLLPVSVRMIAVGFLLMWKCTFATLAYPSNAILLTNSASSTETLGTVNGFAASTASLCRALGPTVSGLLYSLGLRTGYGGLAWWVAGAVTLVGAGVAMQLEEPRGRMDVDQLVASGALNEEPV